MKYEGWNGTRTNGLSSCHILASQKKSLAEFGTSSAWCRCNRTLFVSLLCMFFATPKQGWGHPVHHSPGISIFGCRASALCVETCVIHSSNFFTYLSGWSRFSGTPRRNSSRSLPQITMWWSTIFARSCCIFNSSLSVKRFRIGLRYFARSCGPTLWSSPIARNNLATWIGLRFVSRLWRIG